ncbi:MAG TPA: right-handed parallel beta-helix repeat-containing protein [Verrucomicrobiae bacterium]
MNRCQRSHSWRCGQSRPGVRLSLRPFIGCLTAVLPVLCLALPARVEAAPGTAQPLQLIRGEVRHVANVAALKSALEAANRAKVATTLLLEDGTYLLDVPALDLQCPGLVIRSAKGNRDAVVVRGPDEGTNAAVATVFLVSANNVVIADLTLGYCRHHGVQVRGESPFDVSGLRVHNCRLVNCNQQFIKGSSSENDPVGATDGCIDGCLFEFTSGWAYQFYTGGIDIHKGVNWVVRDNVFRDLRVPAGQPGMSEHAIHFWKRCPTRPQNILVERNWIVNCDRGIGFGLTDAAGGFNGGASIIRNNMVFNDGTGPRTDVGIGLEHASNVQVDNNTVVIQKYWAPIEYRFAGSSSLVFRNNLVNGPIQRRDDAPLAALTNNLERVEPAWFRNFPAGDLRLTPAAKPAIDAGLALDVFHDDLDTRKKGNQRSRQVQPRQGDPDP